MRRTKIVCTIGPASDSPEKLRALLKAGMDVARFNLAHGSHAGTARTIRELRRQAHHLGRNVAILADLPGPKIRITELPAGPVELAKGDSVWLCGTATELRRAQAGAAGVGAAQVGAAQAEVAPPDTVAAIGVSFARISRDVPKNRQILVADGLIVLKAVSRGPGGLLCRVVEGGTVGPRMGVTIPGLSLDVPALTENDRAHLAFAAPLADWVAMSFVRGPSDVEELRAALDRRRRAPRIVAKIELPEAVRRIKAIVAAADGVMVARGDLGVQLPPERVPFIQDQVIETALSAGKPAITATQMFESMVVEPRPTRAEVSDVHNAVLDHTDAVMLSAETATGAHPVEAVRWMDRVTRTAEKRMLSRRQGYWRASVTEAMAQAAADLAYDLDAAAIVTATQSGETARRVCALRPEAPILAVTPNPDVVRQLALSWGVMAVRVPPSRNIEQMLDQGVVAAAEAGLARSGDRLVLTAGVMVNVPGTTNLIKVHVV